MRHVIALLTAVAALIGGARTGHAAITFEYDAICTFQCFNIGLDLNDPVSGWISFNDAAVTPGATVGKADVVDFAFDFGTVHITFATAQAYKFSGVLDGTATAFSFFDFGASEAVTPSSGDAVTARIDVSFVASTDGHCTTTTCDGMNFGAPTHGTPGTLVVQDVRNVPEPGTLALFGAALAGLAFVRRRAA